MLKPISAGLFLKGLNLQTSALIYNFAARSIGNAWTTIKPKFIERECSQLYDVHQRCSIMINLSLRPMVLYSPLVRRGFNTVNDI
jgi:hypothetical protein